MNRRDFGSFHASNVEELISLSEKEYQLPEIPIKLPAFSEYKNKEVTFGKEMKQKHFLLGDDYTFINQGAFGAVIKDVLLAAQQEWQLYIDKQPVKFFDRELLPHLVYVTRRMAKFIGCDPSDLVLVPNVTTAINSVLRSFPLSSGDEVMYFNTEYGAVKKAIREICKERGATMHEQNIAFPVMNEHEIIKSLLEGLHDNTKLLVLDHIPSNTPFIMPVKSIVNRCHARNVKVLVDGAHALGQLHLDVNSLGADFYATNCHKWFGSAKGAALLYVAKPYQDTIMPLIISHGYDSGFVSRFSWTGLRDYSPFLALHTALDFWISVKPGAVRDYTHALAKQAGDILVEAWCTQLLASSDMTGSMLCVQLPEDLYKQLDCVNYSHAEAIQNTLYNRFNIEVPVKVINNSLYVRISAYIYNTLEDYKCLADAVIILKMETSSQMASGEN